MADDEPTVDPEEVTPPHGDKLLEEEPDHDADAELEEAASAVEDDLARFVSERDEYLALAKRVQADFENFRKRMLKQGADERDRGSTTIVEKLLPVLDACNGALAHDDAKPHVRPLYDLLMDVFEKEGLELVYPVGEPFDPTRHEAVMHEADDDPEGGPPTVSEVLRSGYLWKGKVLRPAMVKVKG